MNTETSPRYLAVSMELAAYLDGHYVEMHIVTDTGKTFAIVCPRDSIFKIQRHIEQIGLDCPQIERWTRDPDSFDGDSDEEPSAGRVASKWIH